MGFPKDFIWGTATSAYQIEGAAFEDGKGLNIWDVFTRQQGKVSDGNDGSVACDHYHKYPEDIKIMKKLNLKAYRFSISWPRILPDGVGKINEKGLAFYSDLVDRLLKNGITPYITLYHWDLPYELFKQGGWLNPDIPNWFAEYAKIVAKALGDRVKHFITFNEPQCFIGYGYHGGSHPPGYRESNGAKLMAAHHVLLSHGKAVMAIKAQSEGIGVGYAPCSNPAIPETKSPNDIDAARKAYFSPLAYDDSLSNTVTWWSDPIMLGEYPKESVSANEKDMPKIGPKDMKIISQPLDFYCQNIYNGYTVKADDSSGWKRIPRKAGSPITACYWPVSPECMYWGPHFLYERYKKPIYISENGLSCHDLVSPDGKVRDPNRIDFLTAYLKELKRACEDNIPIKGYFLWSLLDNFEWQSGYTERFGIVYVDFETRQRIIKESGYWYESCIRNNGEGL